MKDKYFDLLNYFMKDGRPWVTLDWANLPAGLSGELCFGACMEGLIQSFCETETYQITQAGIDRWNAGVAQR